ncbi:MAG: tRNA pseudouridine(38-40) synthase TruA [Pirellulales bacterium]|nr:tRNA pseudouridine(38-40) synthase TruA [Pirellulales bacterium]
MAHYKLTLAYDGTDFRGWQAQPKQRTVQSVLQEAWREITGEVVQVTASSRTDAGVHALGQAVGVETHSSLPPEKLLSGINAKLPADVALRAVVRVPDGFHATHDAVGKRYRYRIHSGRQRPLMDRSYVWHVVQELDVEAMQAAANHWIGTHDFASFQSSGSPRENTVRTIRAIEVKRGELTEQIRIEVEGDGFLYNMVRNIAGTLVEVGLGKRLPRWAAEVLAAGDRRAAGRTAPARGLVLLWVQFDEGDEQ